MTPELERINKIFLIPLGLNFQEVKTDPESSDYSGFNLKIANRKIKFRKAKITPKKTGQFVTFWKRNIQGITEPFHSNGLFHFYIIHVENEQNKGCFLFSEEAFAMNGILSTASKEGKRGFRLYPPWDIPTNKQALKTQQWQLPYFIKENDLEKFKMLISE